jgi:hypothetical protein
MTSPVLKVLEMVRAGQISKEQGDELLAALQSTQHPLSRLLFTPFERLGVGASLAIGAAVSALSAALMLLGTHFDGILDVHYVERALPLREILVEQLLVWPFLSAVLWLAALLTGRRGRLIDFLAHTGVARAPMLLGGLGAWALYNGLKWIGPSALAKNAGLAGFGWAILCSAWFIALLYQGYRTASGGRGVRAAVSFIVALVLAEVAGEIVLAALPLRG